MYDRDANEIVFFNITVNQLTCLRVTPSGISPETSKRHTRSITNNSFVSIVSSPSIVVNCVNISFVSLFLLKDMLKSVSHKIFQLGSLSWEAELPSFIHNVTTIIGKVCCSCRPPKCNVHEHVCCLLIIVVNCKCETILQYCEVRDRCLS